MADGAKQRADRRHFYTFFKNIFLGVFSYMALYVECIPFLPPNTFFLFKDIFCLGFFPFKDIFFSGIF